MDRGSRTLHRNLRDFLELLRRENELVAVDAPIDPCLEIAEVHRRVIGAGGPALLFRRPVGGAFPVVTNLFGSARRVDLAFGRRPQDFLARLVGLAETMIPPTLGRLWEARDVGRALVRVGTRRRGSGPITEVVERPARLRELPVLTCWPKDGGPFLTLPLVYTEHPETGTHNLGIYRMQLHDETSLGMHWQIGKGGGFHYHESERRGQALPVTVILGGPPALVAAALAPLPENVGELLVASLLLGRRLPLAECSPHALVAEAEIALVGEVCPGERRPEGPFGDHYGYYSLQHDYPVFRPHTLLRRRDAMFPATVVGKPRQEDFFLGDYLQELLKPLFPLVMPGVRDLWSYGETGYHSLAAAVVRDRYAREAMVSAFRILGEGQLALTKFLLVTDTGLELKNFRRLLAHILARARFERDLFVFGCLSMDTLDYTGPAVNEGSKGVLLGLGDPIRKLPTEVTGDLPPGVARALPYAPGCLVIETTTFSQQPEVPLELLGHPAFATWPLLVLVDDVRKTVSSDARFLWTVFTRFEPAADLHARQRRIVRNQISFEPPILVDARMKPTYPEELFCDPETAATVGRRWLEYFPKGLEMGDSDVANL